MEVDEDDIDVDNDTDMTTMQVNGVTLQCASSCYCRALFIGRFDCGRNSDYRMNNSELQSLHLTWHDQWQISHSQ